MDFEFSEDQQMLRDSVARFLADRAPLTYVREMYDDPSGTTDAVWSGLAQLGLTGILVPEDQGGLGMGMVDMGVVLEEMGRLVHPGPFLVSAVGAASLLALAGGNDAADLLGEIASGGRVATIAVFEPERRWAWRDPHAQAKDTGDHWSITGTKVAVFDGARADTLLVVAAADDELAVFAVNRDADGVTIEPAATSDGGRKRATVTFADAPARRIGRGDATGPVEETLDRLAVALTVEGVGAATAALDMSLAYAKERVQFDRPIGSFQSIQHLCADMLRDVELARAGAYYGLWACDAADHAERHHAATMAKAWASDALARVGASTIQIHGGIGFTWEHDAHLFHKRLLGLQHDLGGSQEHLEELARLVLD